MLPRSKAIALGLASAALAAALGRAPERVTQPMAFSHRHHLEQETTCGDCHSEAARGRYAALPLVRQCMLCHDEPQGQHPDEPLVRRYAERGEEIPWAQANRMPGHVYFSHAPHVKLAEMECKACHGDMESAEEPVTRSQVAHLTMARCMRCHARERAANECAVCHE